MDSADYYQTSAPVDGPAALSDGPGVTPPASGSSRHLSVVPPLPLCGEPSPKGTFHVFSRRPS